MSDTQNELVEIRAERKRLEKLQLDLQQPDAAHSAAQRQRRAAIAKETQYLVVVDACCTAALHRSHEWKQSADCCWA